MSYSVCTGLTLSAFIILAPPLHAATNSDVVMALQIGSDYAAQAALRSGAEIERQRVALVKSQAETLRALNRAGIAERDARLLRAQLEAQQAQSANLVGQLAKRDDEFAAQIKSYTEGLKGLLAQPDPAMLALLTRCAEGDDSALRELPALTELLTIASTAGVEAHAAAIAKENARKWRSTALVLADGQARGKVSTEEILSAWRKATKYDPGNHWQWVQIARLEAALGHESKVAIALERAMSTATNNMQRADTLLLYVRKLYGSPPGFTEDADVTESALALYRGYLDANPGNPFIQGQVLRILDTQASQQHIEVTAGSMNGQPASPDELAGARKLLDGANAIAEMLVARFPDDDDAALLAWRHFKVSGEVAIGQRRYDDGFALLSRAGEIARQVSARGSTSEAVRQMALTNLRDTALLKSMDGDARGARIALMDYALGCDTMWASDPANVFKRSDSWHAYTGLGMFDQAEGDFAAAVIDYQKALKIGEASATLPAIGYMVMLTWPRLSQAQASTGDVAAAEAAFRANIAFATAFPAEVEDPSSEALANQFGLANVAFKARRYDLARARLADLSAAIGATAPDAANTPADLDEFRLLHDIQMLEILIDTGDFDGAITAQEQAISDAEAHAARDLADISARFTIVGMKINLLDLMGAIDGWAPLVNELETLSNLPPGRMVRTENIRNALTLARERAKVAIAPAGIAASRRITCVKATLAVVRQLDHNDQGDGYFAALSGYYLAILARLPGSGVRWTDVADHYRDMVARRLIGPNQDRTASMGLAFLRERQAGKAVRLR